MRYHTKEELHEMAHRAVSRHIAQGKKLKFLAPVELHITDITSGKKHSPSHIVSSKPGMLSGHGKSSMLGATKSSMLGTTKSRSLESIVSSKKHEKEEHEEKDEKNSKKRKLTITKPKNSLAGMIGSGKSYSSMLGSGKDYSGMLGIKKRKL